MFNACSLPCFSPNGSYLHVIQIRQSRHTCNLNFVSKISLLFFFKCVFIIESIIDISFVFPIDPLDPTPAPLRPSSLHCP